jgi:hypothetical protein
VLTPRDRSNPAKGGSPANRGVYRPGMTPHNHRVGVPSSFSAPSRRRESSGLGRNPGAIYRQGAMGSLIKKRRKRMRKKKHKKLLRRTRHQRRARGK